jgi:hypothetical protein
MTLLITLIALVITSIVWYFNANSNKYYLHVLMLMYLGASIMWFVDAIFDIFSLRDGYFTELLANGIQESVLGVMVVVLGLIIWLIVLLIKDPNNKFKKQNKEA